ncbi:SRPBCC family protein [Halocynthiibacter namhaensis]|uniref:SRPBCC family protein n=1 Tax=Halocynthiibacter namhaensis TaxID=1290553 RepID=UPI0005795913|nr:SRPBCC family protein [Halocynthiibacter namhaensis]
MKFTAKSDTDAPVEEVFRQCSDFAAFETHALQRGVQVSYRTQLKQPGAERGWDLRLKLRGRPRDIEIELVGYEAPNRLIFVADGGGVVSDIVIDVVELARQRSRLHLSVDLRPQSMGGRILIQSLKLAKGTLKRRLDKRVVNFAQQIEENVPAS